MKKIGLIGGTGPESTLMYYKELNARIDRITNEAQMPDVAIESVDFRKAWRYVSSGAFDDLSDYLAQKAKALSLGGAEVIALTAATMHIVFQEVQNKAGVSLVSIPKAVCEAVLADGCKSVGLLGTIFTMEQDYMKRDLLDAGVSVIIPDKSDRDLVARRIYEELEVGIVKESTLNEFRDIIKKMRDNNGIEAVILGCTELPLLLNDDNCPLPCLDSVDIHLNKLIRLAMGQENVL